MRLLPVSQMYRPLIAFIIVVVAGCSDVPKSYRIDSGVYPEYQDDEVRFRTTYYLRVFDLCPVDEGSKDANGKSAYTARIGALTSRTSGGLHLVKDSLFRFRMTGQASALFSNLHFESGVLGAEEIDPFGKTVTYDEARKKFEAFNGALQRYGAARGTPTAGLEKCPSGEPLDRRFYLLGPEGIRELDPNERLVMAMYTNAKPLINSLKHLAGHRDNQAAAQLLPFDLELSKTRAESALSVINDKQPFVDQPGGLPSPMDLGNALLPLFGKEGRQ